MPASVHVSPRVTARMAALLGAFLRLVENSILAVVTVNGFVVLRRQVKTS